MTAMAGMLLISGTFFVSSVALAATPHGGLFELEGNATSSNGSVAGCRMTRIRCVHDAARARYVPRPTRPGATRCRGRRTATAPSRRSALPRPDCTIFTGGGSKDPQDSTDGHGRTTPAVCPTRTTCCTASPRATRCHSIARLPGHHGDRPRPCEVIFFGNDRFDNSGNAQVGLSFFKNQMASGLTPVAAAGCRRFKRQRQTMRNGDLLLISKFSNGGTTSTIDPLQIGYDLRQGRPRRWPGRVSATRPANAQRLPTPSAGRPTQPSPASPASSTRATDRPCPRRTLDRPASRRPGVDGEYYEGGVDLSSAWPRRRVLRLGGIAGSALVDLDHSRTSRLRPGQLPELQRGRL